MPAVSTIQHAVTNYAELMFYLNLSNFVLTCVVGLYAWTTRRDRATYDRISTVESALSRRLTEVEAAGVTRGDGHRARLDQLLERIARLEERVSALPSAAALATVNGEVQAVREAVSGVDDRLRVVLAQLQLINQHVLDRRIS